MEIIGAVLDRSEAEPPFAASAPPSIGRLQLAPPGPGALLREAMRVRRGGHPVFHCLGGSTFATHAVVNRAPVVRVDPDIPGEVAVLAHGGAVVNSARSEPQETVMVERLGGDGLAAVLVALAHDCGVTEPYTRQQLADVGVKATVVIEVAGSARALETALAATFPGGEAPFFVASVSSG